MNDAMLAQAAASKSEPPDMRWIGIDVGGANIKAADTSGWTCAEPFALWKYPERLADQLRQLLPTPTAATRYALTMTGELADCFVDRPQGVRQIVDAVAEATQLKASAGVDPLRVYSLDGQWLRADEAKSSPDDVAAANWHATASYAARYLGDNETGLMIDIGSTTTDLIAVDSRGVPTSSRTDLDRLERSELLYLGVGRTPLCAVTSTLPFRGREVPVMAEFFATTDDCFLVLGRTAAMPEDCDSADGKPRTVQHSINRIARMIGLDHRTFTLDDAIVASKHIEAILKDRIAAGIAEVASDASAWVIAGHGDWLLPESVARQISLAQELGVERSRVGPAYALACLAESRFA
ncbi:Hydantoinase/oxoprolinase [Rosistilla carotiformis]|uniref:Hydantoinase/oxoprolinase n=1 Tax=Rosistilla carotiformis TaxID=2528017 RepID=A0A518JXI6_9BACT|nr:hydantoinase/oxoprolinase family protein [Rosistilla carotiformis]QDV70252.1 Hydantoinase/oxoprolinase [Rosistilla carotiformis]